MHFCAKFKSMATSSSNVAAILKKVFTTSLQDSDQLALSEMVTDLKYKMFPAV